MSTLKSNDSRVEKQSPQRALPARTGGLLRTFALDGSHDISVEAYTFYKKKLFVCLFVCLFSIPRLSPPPYGVNHPETVVGYGPASCFFEDPENAIRPLQLPNIKV